MENERIRVLLVEDNPDDANLLNEMLSETNGFETSLTSVERLSDALRHIADQKPDLILLDLSLPDSHGIETFARIKSETPETPVIVLTGLDDETVAIQAAREGAQDYLVKGQVTGGLLNRSICYAIERHRILGELKRANEKALEHQKSLLAEERLKVLLQMAGSMAHELNQPLMGLLGNIELLKMYESDPGRSAKYLERIEEAGQRIANIVKKIQNIRQYDTKPYLGATSIIDLDQSANILYLEDSTEGFEEIKAILKNHGQTTLSHAVSIENAMRILDRNRIDLIILHHILPDGNSFDFLTMMYERALDIPVVVIADKGDEIVASQIIQAGAYDYLPKQTLSEKSLSRSIRNIMEKVRLKKEVKLATVRMAEISTRDELTGLYNRAYFMEALERNMARAKRYGSDLVICMLEPDHFKRINEGRGRIAGDAVLSTIGRILKEGSRECDIACRYSGRRFAVLLPQTSTEKAQEFCSRISRLAADDPELFKQYQIKTHIIYASITFDGALHPTPHDFLQAADQALGPRRT
ncbi:MAG: response regulator [Pseudomonadota bacterium]